MKTNISAQYVKRPSQLGKYAVLITFLPVLCAALIASEMFTHGLLINSLSEMNARILSETIKYIMIVCPLLVLLIEIIHMKRSRARFMPVFIIMINLIIACAYFYFIRSGNFGS